jgi:tetratricopeptide (TPR) repeat protein
MLEAALGEDPSREKAYIYLSIIYENAGEHEKAADILEKGLPYAAAYVPQFHFNVGNNYFALGNFEQAEKAYTAAIASKSAYAEAYLNRANARVQQTRYTEAVADYNLYLKLNPRTKQKQNIEQVIDILTKRLAEAQRLKREEEQRLRDEEEHRKAEDERKAEEEQLAREEEERRREEERKRQEALLQEVLKSLNEAEEDTTELQAGSEDIKEFDVEIELEP